MNSTRISRRVNAPRSIVYRALLDARAVATWMVPAGMSSHVHAFEAREGGSFRISLMYDEPTGTDTYHGRFMKLVTNEQVVEVVEFETTDPALRGEMTITISLAEAGWDTRDPARDDGMADISDSAMMTTRTVSVSISASPERVYEFAVNPANLPKWAPGFFKSIANRDGQWVAETTMGEVKFAFAQRNSFGVLDHGVTLPSGESFFNPMRVVANGQGSEVLFTLFRHPPMTEAEFDQDAKVVLGDLEKLKAVIEALC